MKRNIWIMIAILTFATVPASAQLGSLKKMVKKKKPAKTEKKKTTPKKSNSTSKPSSSKKNVNKDLPNDPNYYYVGANDMAGTSVGELRVCSDHSASSPKINWQTEFKDWSTAMSDNARTKSFHAKQCELLGFGLMPKQRGAMYRKVDDLKAKADGLSVYQVEKGKLVLVKTFASAAMYVVVAPRAAKSGLTMKDLVLCVSYALRGNYKRKVKSTSGCNKVESRVDYLGYYKADKKPGEYDVNSALFTEAEFKAASKKGTFKGYKIYTLVGDNLKPMK